MTPGDALAALQDAHAARTAHPVPTLRAWARLAGVDGTLCVNLTTGDATVTKITPMQGGEVRR